LSMNKYLYEKESGGTTKAEDREKHLFFATFSILMLKHNG